MKKTVFAKDEHNQYNVGTIVKEVADFYGQAIRTTDADSVVTGYFTHFRATYDGQNNPTEVSYFRGATAYQTTVTFSPASSLNNKYFILHSAPSEQVYVIWFDVDGTGTAPVYSGTKIRVQISASDSAEIVAAMVQLTLNTLYSDTFTAGTRNGATLDILTTGLGEAPDSFDINTGFTFVLTPGTQELVSKITIPYSGTDPVYQGQVLKGYSFDVYSGKFEQKVEINVDNIDVNLDSATDSVTIGDVSGNKATVTSGKLNVETGLDLSTLEQSVDDVVTALNNPMLTAGTVDGTLSGDVYVNVYNVKQQVLDSHDRVANFIYADFGTKNQRVTRIDYTSSTFPGVVVRRDFSYTLVSNFYRRDNETWTVV